MNKQKRELIKTVFDALKNGEISRGNQLLTERELAEKFGVKRTALREALIALETLGIIDIRERQGMFIGEGNLDSAVQGLDRLSSSSPVDILSQGFEVRIMIEPAAVALAAQRRTERDIALLRGEIDFFRYLNTTNPPDRSLLGSQHNAILHNLIISAADNMVLHRIYEGISKLSQHAFTVMGNSRLDFHPYALWPDILFEEHCAIVDAIIEGDPQRAMAAMLLHLENSKTRNQDAIRDAQLYLKNNINMLSGPRF